MGFGLAGGCGDSSCKPLLVRLNAGAAEPVNQIGQQGLYTKANYGLAYDPTKLDISSTAKNVIFQARTNQVAFKTL
jgi:hypothetical protein